MQPIHFQDLKIKIMTNHTVHKNLIDFSKQVKYNSYELYIREKKNDYAMLVIFNQSNKEQNYSNATALFIENDEDFCKDMEQQFLQFN
jgi:hypothetical protein